MALNVTTAAIASGANTAIAQPSLAQWDQGQILKIEGVELPESYQVEFSGGGTVRTVPMIGTAEGVQIPNKLLQSSHPITAHVVLHESATDRETEYWITIYVKPRQAPETVEIDPADISIIDQTIAAAQQAVATSTAQAEAAAGSAESAAASAEAAAAGETAAAGSASSAASSARSAGASAVEADQAKTAAETAQTAAEAAQAAAEQAVTDAQAAGSQAVEEIDEANAAGIQAIDAEAATQINQVGRAGATQIRQINELASNQMRSIETKTTQSIGAIEDARDAAIDDVQAEGQTQTAAAQEQAQAAAGSASAAANSASAAAGSASAAATARTGAETAAASVSASAAQIAQNASDITDLNRQISESITPAIEQLAEDLDGKAPVIVNTASGDIASFADGAEGMPIKSLVANIEPVQDLHGYDYPWPEGGGVNMLDADGYTLNAEAGVNKTYIIPYNVYLEAGQAYTLSCRQAESVGSATRNLLAIIKSGDTVPIAYETSNQFVAHVHTLTYTPTESGNYQMAYWAHTLQNAVTIDQFQVEKGSAFTTYAPYSNICPISGWTGAEITGCGKNLYSYDNAYNGYWLVDGFHGTGNKVNYDSFIGWGFIKIRVKPNDTIRISNTQARNGTFCTFFGDTTQNIIQTVLSSEINSVRTVPLGAKWIGISFFKDNTINPKESFPDAQVEINTNQTTFEPYTGNQISVTFPSSAGDSGTVYGGTLTLTPDRTGTLVVDMARYKFTGNESLYAQISANSVAVKTGSNWKSSQTGWCTDFKSSGTGATNFIYLETTMPAADVKTYMANHDVYAVCELATPISYQLTESEISTILTTLHGTNNVWADTGDVEVTYPADTKLYIEKLTQPTEDDMTADHAIASGTFFMVGNNLYLATSQIAAGGTITPGTNATQLSLADALNQLNT